jgi:AcrR family transcriptional regulator
MKEKKVQILDAAEKAFAEHGFKEASTRLIAQLAEVNVSMISYYFHSKEKLLEKVLERRIMHFDSLWNQLTTNYSSTIDRLLSLITLSIDIIRDNPTFFKFLLHEQLINSQTESGTIIKNYIEQRLKTISDILSEGVVRKEIPPIDIDLTCMAISGTYINCLLNADFFEKSNTNIHDRLIKFFEQKLNALLS